MAIGNINGNFNNNNVMPPVSAPGVTNKDIVRADNDPSAVTLDNWLGPMVERHALQPPMFSILPPLPHGGSAQYYIQRTEELEQLIANNNNNNRRQPPNNNLPQLAIEWYSKTPPAGDDNAVNLIGLGNEGSNTRVATRPHGEYSNEPHLLNTPVPQTTAAPTSRSVEILCAGKPFEFPAQAYLQLTNNKGEPITSIEMEDVKEIKYVSISSILPKILVVTPHRGAEKSFSGSTVVQILDREAKLTDFPVHELEAALANEKKAEDIQYNLREKKKKLIAKSGRLEEKINRLEKGASAGTNGGFPVANGVGTAGGAQLGKGIPLPISPTTTVTISS